MQGGPRAADRHTSGQDRYCRDIAAIDPDHIILATGALRNAPAIPGREQRHVSTATSCAVSCLATTGGNRQTSPLQRLVLKVGRASQLLRNIRLMRFLSKLWMPIPGKVVIVGGGLVGLELAEYLVERRRHVTVLECGPAFGPELSIVRRARVLHLLQATVPCCTSR
ncbi:MAG: FAD-dependent oxidoreductase [Halioglobus sp.]